MGKDLEKVKEGTLQNLKEKMPRVSKVVKFFNLVYFHGIVNVAVFTFLLILSLMSHNVLNDIS